MKYVHWPLDISVPVLDRLEGMIESELVDIPSMPPHIRAELENLRNEARAMVQQIMSGTRKADIDPLLR